MLPSSSNKVQNKIETRGYELANLNSKNSEITNKSNNSINVGATMQQRIGYSNGSVPYGSSMGYGYGSYPMMGSFGYNSGMMGPFGWIYSINYFIMNMGQVMDMLGMNTHALLLLVKKLRDLIKRIELAVRHSEFRRWLQRKSKKSQLLRFLFVFTAMAVTSQIIKLVRLIFELNARPQQIEQRISKAFLTE
jgi:hypothetical protein